MDGATCYRWSLLQQLAIVASCSGPYYSTVLKHANDAPSIFHVLLISLTEGLGFMFIDMLVLFEK